MSASYPTANWPIFSNPRTFADPSVASCSASLADNHFSVAKPSMRERYDASRVASNMFCPSDVLLASVPTPTTMPFSIILRTGATPDPSRRLLHGLWATRTPRCANRAISSSPSQMAWAALRRSERKSRSSKCSTRLLPYRANPRDACARDSAR